MQALTLDSLVGVVTQWCFGIFDAQMPKKYFVTGIIQENSLFCAISLNPTGSHAFSVARKAISSKQEDTLPKTGARITTTGLLKQN